MLVKELIGRLQQCHPEAHVTLPGVEIGAVRQLVPVSGETPAVMLIPSSQQTTPAGPQVIDGGTWG
jgi:hypothetical protein